MTKPTRQELLGTDSRNISIAQAVKGGISVKSLCELYDLSRQRIHKITKDWENKNDSNNNSS